MPFTPLHMGVAFTGQHFLKRYCDWIVFGLCQLAMDIEVLIRVGFGIFPIHGFTNTILGATFVAILMYPIARPLGNFFRKAWNTRLSGQQKNYLAIDEVRLSSLETTFTLLIGVYSHWILDAIMHSDSAPFWPISNQNPFLGILSISNLNFYCGALIILGVVLAIWRRRRRRRRRK